MNIKTILVSFFLISVVFSLSDCPKGQFYKNGLCTKLSYISGCGEYNNNGECSRCQYGYLKDPSDGSCQFNQGSQQQCCLQFDLYGNCKQCSYGLYVSQNKCKRNKINGCVIKQGNLCQACGNGFYLTNNKCYKNIIGCELYNDDGTCSRCTTNLAKTENCSFKFVLKYGICLKQKISLYSQTNYVSKCRKQNSFGCVECEKDNYLDENKKCQGYEPGCLLYFQGKCQECSSFKGYYLDNTTGKCVNKYQFYSVENCFQYSTQYDGIKCLACRTGFRLIDGNKCVAEFNLDIKIKKCCAQSYYLSSDYKCKKSSGNLVKQYEQQKPAQPKQPGCIYQYGKCQFCQEPFKKTKDGKCSIPNCMEFEKKKLSKYAQETYQCISCRYPFELDSNSKQCIVPYCAKYQNSQCVLCAVGYHLKAYETCHLNDINCLSYDQDGNCEQCRANYFISSVGECMLKQSNCITHYIKEQMPICTTCAEGYFLNVNNQCQKIDINCQYYVNGVCKSCNTRYFLHQYICFPFTIGCVKYAGINCVQCKRGYTMFNNQCYNLETLGMKLEGQDDNYDFDIYPIDISKSKYYIDNLSPISALNSEFIYSSAFNKEYLNPSLTFSDQQYDQVQKRSNGWKSLESRSGEYLGYKLHDKQDSVTFYALQLEFIEKSTIQSFYLEYTKDGVNWIRVENRFFTEQHINSGSSQYLEQNGIITVYFTGIYASAIRIVIDEYTVWPACKIQFFYYDLLRYRKISNLKSLRYLRESIQSNFVDRLDNQLYINQKYFFNPNFQCHAGQDLACFTGLQLCQPRKVPYIELINQNKYETGLNSYVSEFYVTFSTNGRNFECYKQCKKFSITENDLLKKQNGQYSVFTVDFNGQLIAKNVRIYPTKWFGTPKLSISYDHQ